MLIIESKTASSGATEPVTLSEAHTYFRSEDSDGVEDTLINNLISAARAYIEKRTNRSLIDSDLVVTFAEGFKGYLPYGPLTGTITWTDDEPASTYGEKYPYVEIDTTTKATYSTEAYSDSQVKQAVLELAMFMYERGDFTWDSLPVKLKTSIAQFSRVPMI